MFFVGVVVGSVFIPRLTDVYGRKWPFLLCILVQFPFYYALLYSRSLDLNIGLSFFLGVCYVGRYNGGYLNISEYVHNKWKNLICTFLLVWDSLVTIILAFYFRNVSKNWIELQIFGVAINAIAIIGAYFTPESPEYLYCFYKFNECRDAIVWIAEFNKHDIDRRELFFS